MAYNDIPSDMPNGADTQKSNSSLYPVITEDQYIQSIFK